MSEQKTVRQILEQPFAENLIKFRPGHFGQTLAYVEAPAFIRRLNEAFEGQWSFDVAEFKVLDTEVLVLGKLDCQGIVKMAFGGSQITREKESGEIISLVDDLKSAATDALKKACSLFGIGLHLYEDGGEKNPAPDKSSENQSSSDNGNGNGTTRITSKQLAYLYTLIKAKQMSKDDLQRLSVDRYQKMPDFISKQQASDLIKELQIN